MRDNSQRSSVKDLGLGVSGVSGLQFTVADVGFTRRIQGSGPGVYYLAAGSDVRRRAVVSQC